MEWMFQQDRPIYTQLLEQLQLRIVCGIYEPGGKLPSVRELAGEASVNPNTVQKSLSELERTGLINTQRTTGRFVTQDVDMIAGCRRKIAQDKAASFLQTMYSMGYSGAEVLQLMEDHARECQERGREEITK